MDEQHHIVCTLLHSWCTGMELLSNILYLWEQYPPYRHFHLFAFRLDECPRKGHSRHWNGHVTFTGCWCRPRIIEKHTYREEAGDMRTDTSYQEEEDRDLLRCH